ncbi:hypothetical protein BC332_13279 [Capsicum chinense]|nr:hypothetical protein BC332_13279 [Capsicum chinense]
MQFKIQKSSPSLRFLTVTAVAVGASFLDLQYIISTLDSLKKEHYLSVATDIKSVASNEESVASDVESDTTNVKSIATDVESIATDVESVATDM